MIRKLGATVALVVAFAATRACSSSAPAAGVCTYPAKANTYGDSSTGGCKPSIPGKLCEVSNGASVMPNGSVSGGTETCSAACTAGQYELTCSSGSTAASGGAIPSPDPSLGCTVLALPTPSNALFYCCACTN